MIPCGRGAYLRMRVRGPRILGPDTSVYGARIHPSLQGSQGAAPVRPPMFLLLSAIAVAGPSLLPALQKQLLPGTTRCIDGSPAG